MESSALESMVRITEERAIVYIEGSALITGTPIRDIHTNFQHEKSFPISLKTITGHCLWLRKFSSGGKKIADQRPDGYGTNLGRKNNMINSGKFTQQKDTYCNDTSHTSSM